MKPVEGQADVKPPPYCGVIAFKDSVEPHKARGPQPMNPEQKKAPAAAPQPQHPHNGLRDGVGMLTPAYMRESLYEDENRNMTKSYIFCALMLFFAITIGVIFFLSQSSQMMAALERTTTMAATTPLTPRPSYGRAMLDTTTFANNGGTPPRGVVPLVTDDRLSSEKEVDETKASNTTTTCGNIEELSVVAVQV
ncbi:hypothetical protein MTO96_034139 [Rhipicephalus appendiculatus]